MISRILIPQAFENMEEATIGRWLKSEGDTVALGDGLCELITEKTTFDLPAEAEGVLRRIVAPEKSIVPVGYVIALIGDAGDELPDVTAVNAATLERPKSGEGVNRVTVTETADLKVPSLAAPSPQSTLAPTSGSRIRATPAARRAAKEAGVDLEAVAAANPGKVLSEDDVKNFAAAN